jgi:hypothetical protein
MTYQFDGEPRYNLNLDSETLLPTANMPVPASTLKVASSPVPALAALEGDTNAAIRSAGYENLGGPLMSLRYRALPANNDKPFTCPPRPAAYCNPPPSALVLDTLWPK